MKTFTLEDNEAAFIVRVIGQLPTESGAYPLLQKLQQQYALIEEPKEPTNDWTISRKSICCS